LVRSCPEREAAFRPAPEKLKNPGGYMIATCNSIFEGMNRLAVTEMFRYETAVGFY
jgi:hypothetical protein